jgi:hypothetical protein
VNTSPRLKSQKLIPGIDLLCALVNLLQERAKDLTTQHSLTAWTLYFRDRIDERINTRIRLGLVLLIVPIDADFAEDLLDLCLGFGILAAIIGIQDRTLCRVRVREGRVDAPRTFVIHDVSADLADFFGRPCIVEIVVPDLEVFSERQENVAGDLVIVRIGIVLLLDGEATEEQRESDRKVESACGGLVEDYRPVPA